MKGKMMKGRSVPTVKQSVKALAEANAALTAEKALFENLRKHFATFVKSALRNSTTEIEALLDELSDEVTNEHSFQMSCLSNEVTIAEQDLRDAKRAAKKK